jgi:hypothetical protein
MQLTLGIKVPRQTSNGGSQKHIAKSQEGKSSRAFSEKLSFKGSCLGRPRALERRPRNQASRQKTPASGDPKDQGTKGKTTCITDPSASPEPTSETIGNFIYEHTFGIRERGARTKTVGFIHRFAASFAYQSLIAGHKREKTNSCCLSLSRQSHPTACSHTHIHTIHNTQYRAGITASGQLPHGKEARPADKPHGGKLRQSVGCRILYRQNHPQQRMDRSR